MKGRSMDEPRAGAPGTGHRQIEHTADLALELWGPTEEELLVEGARAIVELLTEGATVEARDRRSIELDALDPEDRLVRWLNEVLTLALVDGYLVADAELHLGRAALEGSLAGEEKSEEKIRSELKGVTYHDLRLVREGHGCQARVVIDI